MPKLHHCDKIVDLNPKIVTPVTYRSTRPILSRVKNTHFQSFAAFLGKKMAGIMSTHPSIESRDARVDTAGLCECTLESAVDSFVLFKRHWSIY